MKKAILFFSVMVIIPNLAKATEAFSFLTDVVESFQTSEIAISRLDTAKSEELITRMKDMIVFNNEIRTAAEFVRPHLASKNEIIKQSAELFLKSYSAIVQNNENALNAFENAINNPENYVSKEGSF